MALKIKNIALVSAAGSGKTHALTKRFLLLYLHDKGYPLNSLYAITFTNAAAYEMKSRIIRYLDVLATGQANDEREKDIKEYFNGLFDDVKERALRKRHYLLNNLADLNVATFHSVFASFLSCIPFAAGIMPDYEIVDEPEEAMILSQSIDKYLENAVSDPAVISIISELIELQEKGIRMNIEKIYSNLIPWHYYLENLVSEEKNIGSRISEDGALFIGRLKELIDFMCNNELAGYTKSTGKQHIHLTGLLSTFQRFANEPNAKNLEPMLKPVFEDGLATKNYIRSFIANLGVKADIFSRVLADFVTAGKAYLESLSDKEILTRLKPILEIHRQFEKAKKQQNVLGFDDIESYTHAALKNSSDIEYLYFKLGARINHLMIDEFQDTSFRQLDILEPLILEITSVIPEEKSLFYVGDPYQAIFRWREGAPELFDYLKEKYKGKIDSDQLSVNYRTTEEIVKFINLVLGKNDRARPDNTGGWIRIEDIGEYARKPDGDEAAINRTAVIIKDLINNYGYKPSDIAVLTRRNAFGALLAANLARLAIPCISRSRASILEETDTQFILHLLKFLDDPEDDFSLLHVLLSPVFRLTEDIVMKLRARGKPLYLALHDYHPEWPAAEKLQKLLSYVYFLNPYELIMRICQVLEFEISYPIATLLDAALEYTKDGFSSLNAFVSWLETSASIIEIKEIHPEGVEILTIHKAKGLEFEIVILPETNWSWLKPENEQLLFTYQKQTARPEKIYWRQYGRYLENLIKAEEERLKKDSLNLLYVAMTRAKSGVYIIGYSTKRTGSGIWLDTIKQKLEGKSYPSDKIPSKQEKSTLRTEEKTYGMIQQESKFIKEERSLYSPTERGVEIIKPERRRSMEFGDIVHKALAKIGWLDGLDTDEVIKDMTTYISDNYIRTTAKEDSILTKLKSMLFDMLSDPDLRLIFYKDNRPVEFRNELAIYFEEEKRDVAIHVDRLLIERDKITIIDYKTGAEKPEYKQQLQVYKKGVEIIYPNLPIDQYLIYLDKPPGERRKKIT